MTVWPNDCGAETVAAWKGFLFTSFTTNADALADKSADCQIFQTSGYVCPDLCQDFFKLLYFRNFIDGLEIFGFNWNTSVINQNCHIQFFCWIFLPSICMSEVVIQKSLVLNLENC